ncbi:hypothetical protein [uncultured Rhodospira sp.]|uniref:hypothetical protein n=1 Tax=uncultured Rhodospira sp. TaxID=1936189 RepID=UPI00260A1DE0|nr:hypothetical protein [uncultured Rhodospira sp.]
MKRTPLQLEASWLDAITLCPSETASEVSSETGGDGEAKDGPVEDGAPDAASPDDLELDFDMSISFHAEDPDLFRLSLRVDSKDEPSRCPYHLFVVMTGQFRIAEDYGDPIQRSRLISNTAPSMLFGAIREQVLTLTGRSAAGPWMLPAVMFPIREDILRSDVADGPTQKGSSASQKVKTKKKEKK